MSTTVTQTVTVDNLFKDQFLAPELEEVTRLRDLSKKEVYKPTIVWRNVALFAALHFGSAIGLYQLIFEAKWMTVAWSVICWMISGIAITAGAHRLWAHKSYKARLPLRILLVAMNCVAF